MKGKESDNNIYVVFSRTNTKIGWLIRKVLKTDYNHVSLLPSLEVMELYSFGRKTYSVPFVGGFIKEDFFRLAYPLSTVNFHICEIPLSMGQRQKLDKIIYDFSQNAEDYLYNLFSFTKLWKGKEYNHCSKTYDCVEFVAEVLKRVEIITESEYVEIDSLKDLYYILGRKSIMNIDMAVSVSSCKYDGKYIEKPFLPVRIIKTINYLIRYNKLRK